METVRPIFVIAFGSRVSWVSRISWRDKFPCTYRIFRIVQVFLVFFCRDKFTCTYVQKCIFLLSLRNWTLRRDCDLVRQVSLYLTNICSNRSLQSRRTCRDLWDQVHRRLWLCHDPVPFFLCLHPVRHRFGAAGQAEILKAEMADVRQIKKIDSNFLGPD